MEQKNQQIKHLLLILLGFITLSFFSHAYSHAYTGEWQEIVNKTKGQTVYFNAWGGSQAVNDYIQWASKQVLKKYNIHVIHVKTADIGSVVSRVLVEKAAKKYENGSVDLIWINGENFKSMKGHKLLYGPFAHKLPNFRFVDINKKTLQYDFSTPIDNMESPWGMAQLVFLYDTAKLTTHPKSMEDLLTFSKKTPGIFTYPAIPSFHGTTFLKQVLYEVIKEPQVLQQKLVLSQFQDITKPLWGFLDTLHPFLWRKGKIFPANASKMQHLLNDSEIFISLNFNPNFASNAIENGELPETVRTYVHTSGTIGNAHFLGIPFNSSAKEAAMVFADFLLSPAAQAKKADPKIWGDPSVLNIAKLENQDKMLFEKIPKGIATLTPEELGQVLPDLHVSWVQALEKEWLKRYSN